MSQTQTNDYMDQASSMMGDTVAMSVGGAVLLLYTLAWIRIFSKAGYHWATGLLMLVPLVNVVMLGVLAFGRWPAQLELASFRKMHRKTERANETHFKRVA